MSPSISRVTRSKEQAKNNYNRLSRWYDFIAGSAEKKYRNIGLAKLNASAGEHILEIGYGTGHSVLALARAVGENGRITALDISEGMHAITQKRIQQAGLSDQVELHIGDALAHPIPPNSFDAVFMSFTLELFDTPEIPLILGKCYEALRANGRIVIVALIKKPGTAVRLYEWFHKKMPSAVDCRPIYAQSDLAAA
ncbi:MAG: methyltransferase domain-containing protein, partial [Chloroflexi bacterium]|nr:methyltransferase domain-containing protein [Chloroflexota bacterium]